MAEFSKSPVVATQTNDDSPAADFLFRVTGKQSVERLVPLVSEIFQGIATTFHLHDGDLRVPTFVWETTCRKEWRAIHNHALVLNKLHNSHVLESKSSMAFLQLTMKGPSLETFVAYSASEVALWAKKRWSECSPPREASSSLAGEATLDEAKLVSQRDWWMVKASRGNGGRDVWVFNAGNVEAVVADLHEDQEYVIQR